jgi:formylglycine-generating enzyme required for sulfatase activity
MSQAGWDILFKREYDVRKTSWVIAALGLLLSSATSGGAAANNAPGDRAPGSRFRECADCPELIVVPAGSFTMGSPPSEEGRFDTEGPQHVVVIKRPFAIGVYDVTVGEYRKFIRATGRVATDGCRVYDPTFIDPQLVRVRGRNWQRPGFPQTDRNPVVCITLEDTRAYVNWLNDKVVRALGAPGGSGLYRLPTEAEWEYAARAGTTTPFYWGATMHRSDANFGPDEMRFAPMVKGADRWGYTSPVGSFPANPFGLFDMSGNAWNFTQDCWHANYDGAPGDGSARTEPKCDERVVRGGSWLKPAAGERSAKRGEGRPGDLKGHQEIGFRVVRDLYPR